MKVTLPADLGEFNNFSCIINASTLNHIYQDVFKPIYARLSAEKPTATWKVKFNAYDITQWYSLKFDNAFANPMYQEITGLADQRI
jgi:hypothetical protein